jgi:hypothetical protein
MFWSHVKQARLENGKTSGSERTWGVRSSSNQGWLATPDLISRVLERCVGEQMCTQLQQIADQAPTGPGPYPVSVYRSGRNENYQVGQYNPKSLELLEAKIAQFPRGTKFSLTPASPQNQDQNQLDDEVQAILEKNGMILLPAAVPPLF